MEEDVFEFPESLEPGELEFDIPEIPESLEVIRFRIQELCEYLITSLPALFSMEGGPGKGSIPKQAMEAVLFELHDEFTSSFLHRVQIIAWMVGVINGFVEGVIHEEVTDFLEKNDSDELEHEEINIEVKWGDIVLSFSDSDSSQIPAAALARAHVIGLFEYDGREPWDGISDTLFETLPDAFPGYWGYFGLILFRAYISVFVNKVAPTVEVGIS